MLIPAWPARRSGRRAAVSGGRSALGSGAYGAREPPGWRPNRRRREPRSHRTTP